jgi:ribosomal protein S18 acetylase RimI-like enzyme
MEQTKTNSPVVSMVAAEKAPGLIARLNEWRGEMPAVVGDADLQVFTVAVDGEVVGGYAMADIGPANEILLLAIDPHHRRRGHGRMCCMDALFRSGTRPLVLTADDDAAGFAKAVGFKIIGKRRLPDGRSIYRFGWHAPRPGTDPSNRTGC